MKTKILTILALLLMTVTQGAWAQETLTVFDGTDDNQFIPMYGYSFNYYTKSECIIPASELTAMEGGTITAITFYAATVTGSNPTFGSAKQQVFLKEVSGTTLSSFSGITTDAVVVYDGTLPMPTTSTDGYTITFSQGYTYNGGNLLIGIYNYTKGSWKTMRWYGIDNKSSGVSAYGASNDNLANAAFKAQKFLPKTTFTYTPAPTAVDLGLPSGKKWADRNVGALSATGYGTYYAWSSSDIATAQWGNDWRMPTKAEIEELQSYTDHEWATIGGINGMKFMKKTDHSVYIFLPATGLNSSTEVGNIGYYWTSTEQSSPHAYFLYASSSALVTSYYRTKTDKLPIRPVQMFAGEGTEASPYLISSTTDWDNLSAAVNGGETYSGKYFKMTANIGTVTTMIGVCTQTEEKKFLGVFDGGGHTLTVNYSYDEEWRRTCPFPYTGASTVIRNLTVAGSIANSWRASGLVGTADGAKIQRCRVSATISGNGYTAAFAVSGGQIENCLFDGKLTGNAGFVGYRGGSGTSITNCLFKPQTGSSISQGTFYSTEGNGAATVTNSYYTSLAGSTAQGTDGSGMTAAQLVQNLGPSNWKVVNGNAIPKVHPNLSGEGTEASPYLIASTTDWNNLVSAVNAGETYSGNYFKMTANVGTVSTWMTGTFSGTFDGDGNTLTVDYTATSQRCGAFGYLGSASIQNLKVAGTISTAYQAAGGLATWCNEGASAYITNCRVSTIISSSVSGDGTHGGFVAYTDGKLYFTGCVFDGSLTGSTTNACSGFVYNSGWNGAAVSLTDCLLAPSSVTIGTGASATFVRGTAPTITNCYYTQTFGTAQGTQARTIAAGNYVSSLSVTKGDATATYDVSGITVYSGGIDFNDGSTTTFYGGSGQTVSLDLTAETRSGYHFKQYAVDKGTIASETTNTPTLTMPAANSTANDVVTISAEYDPFSGGTGTSVNPYQIASTADWNLLVSNVNGGETYSGNYFKMTANVGTVSTWMTGTFSGTFDGDGKTLTVDYSATTEKCAPFGTLGGASIQKLKVAGTITTNQKYAAGIAAYTTGTTYITNCLSSVAISSAVSGDGTHGGLVAVVDGYASLSMTGCAFTGKLLTTNSTTSCGGFVGFRWYTGTLTMTDCLYAPASATGSETWISDGEGQLGNANFSRWSNSTPTFTRCYYTTDFGSGNFTAQGIQARSITGGNYVTVANAGAPTVYNVSGITSYGTGIQYGGVLYGGNEDAVSLTLTAPVHDGYGFVYSADNGTVTGISNPYTLTMVDANAIINVKYSASKAINKYTSDDTSDGWYLIASPIDTVNPQDVANMTSESNTFDIYRFNQNPAITIVEGVDKYLEWENWKRSNEGGINHYHFNLEPGRGYLYANSSNVTLTFIGTPYEGDGIVPLVRSNSNGNDKTNMLGWNLIGNPFGVTAYIDRDFYRMNYGEGNTGGDEIILATTDAIAPMEGIFVYTEEEGDSVTFITHAPSKGHIQKPESEQVVLNLSHDRGSVIDRAIVRMGDPSTGSGAAQTLPKFQIRENSTKLYIPQGTEEYAIVSVGNVGEMPVNFKAKENGNYTISVNPENVEMNYLHLIDNMTGADVDLLQTPSYTFNATTNDYESRFKLVFSTNTGDGASTGSATFAFFSNGSWVIANEGQATLQVIDLMGRILSSETINGSVSKSIHAAPGVYMIRLINGENVKVQKVVIE